MSAFITSLNHIHPEAIWLLQLLVCYCSVLLMLRIFGETGLYVFIPITVIAANIEVLKLVKFSLFADPVTLGTVLFTSTFLSVDILTQYYGPAAGRRGIKFGFAGMLLMTSSMVLALGFKPLTLAQAHHWHLMQAYPVQSQLRGLFSPAPALLFASLTSFLISQASDIWIFQRIRAKTGERHLWLRNSVSTIAAALIDNTIFNTLWISLAGYAIGWHSLIFSYILGTYFIRVAISILDTPFIYLAKYMLPKPEIQTA